MRVTVQLSEKDLKEMQKYSGESTKGRAILSLAEEALRMKKLQKFCDQVMSGQLQIDFPKNMKDSDRGSWT